MNATCADCMLARMLGVPDREIAIDVALVRALLQEQAPQFAELSLSELAEGFDNVVYRLGDAFTVRVPRRLLGGELIRNEQRWLPELAGWLPLAVPAPIWVGAPSAQLSYPWHWHVARWLPGATWDLEPPRDLADAARSLGEFLAAMHGPAPAEAPSNAYRGVALSARTQLLHAGLDRLGARIDRRRVLEGWEARLAVPEWSGPPLWVHGDLHPLNMLVVEGRLAGVIDFGDLCAGDPACDFAVAFMVFDARERALLRQAAGVDEATWRRGEGWALALGVALANASDRLRAIGHRTLASVLY